MVSQWQAWSANINPIENSVVSDVCRPSAASPIRCGSSGSRQLSARGRSFAASAIHAQPLHKPARTSTRHDRLRATQRRGREQRLRPRLYSNCSIKPGTYRFAGEKHVSRRPRAVVRYTSISACIFNRRQGLQSQLDLRRAFRGQRVEKCRQVGENTECDALIPR